MHSNSLDETIKKLAPEAHIHFPASFGYKSLEIALENTTHLLIVAHVDDDGLVGAQAISETFGAQTKHMTVVVVSASPGTGRPPGYENHSDVEMIRIRREEQIQASDTGRYASTIQLGFSSDAIKEQGNAHIGVALQKILSCTPQLEKLYLHSIFDKHQTHKWLVIRSLDAVRNVYPKFRPMKCFGVEASTSAAWLPVSHRTFLPVHHMDIVQAVLRNYKTELAKRAYDQGIAGRAIANSVFQRDTGIPSTNVPQLCAIDYEPVLASRMNILDSMIAYQMDILGTFTRENLLSIPGDFNWPHLAAS